MAIITVELDPNEPLTEEQIKELEALKDRPIIFEKVAEARILLKEYRGFSAMAEYEPESKVFFGRLDGIRDLVTFEAESESELRLPNMVNGSIMESEKQCLRLLKNNRFYMALTEHSFSKQKQRSYTITISENTMRCRLATPAMN